MKRLFILCLSALFALSCTDDMTASKYSNKPAHFSCPSVSSLPPLYSAVNNPGIWCKVRIDNSGQRYQFDSPGQATAYWNITASVSDRAYTWVAGLIIGTPSYPEPGATTSIVTCYDLVCPTCYEVPIDRQLDITQTGYATCGRCGCQYDLNNQGLIVTGPDGCAKSLFRYRVTYLSASNALLVSN